MRRGLAAIGVAGACALVAACSSKSTTTSPAGTASAPGYHPGKFVWHDLITRDPASSRRFYGSLLGWEFENTTRSGKPYAVARVDGQPVAGIVVHPEPGDDPALWLSYLSVPDVDASVTLASSDISGGTRSAAGEPQAILPATVAVLRTIWPAKTCRSATATSPLTATAAEPTGTPTTPSPPAAW